MAIGDTRTAGVLRRRSWQRAYAVRLFSTDIMVVLAAVFGSQFIWFGLETVELEAPQPFSLGASYTAVSLVLVVAWMIMLDVFATRDHKVIGSGTLEYKRVADATIRLFGVFAIVAYLFQIEVARGYFLLALPLGMFLLIGSRWRWRKWLRKRQARGFYLSRALLLGERLKSAHVAATITRSPGSGLLLVGALTQEGTVGKGPVRGVPVVGDYGDLMVAVDETNADTVILTGADEISPEDMRRVGWELEARDVELIVAPALTDIAGPRIHSRPVAGLPLIHVSYPQFEGAKRVTKRTFDILGSALLILLSSPGLIWVAIAVKRSSPGNIVYRQDRIGRHGATFGMYKFRSMVQDADDQLESLLDAQGTSDTPLFKVTNDPRITPVGKILRKYSIDELPQLFNVLFGEMSLVGPRPQRAAEVALYDDAAHRRLIMKPGMSGLWQVSGRSNLSWEDSIRLDLYYVENWSLTADILILWRTVRAVVTPDGAV
ncbi:sugar transferase [Cryobacterium lactosi]|uniref:Sugar transferase n=1 Tax=Cryobacterium lactosi TaxID=1259202 RepID=A0A4R9BY16_9MICO|nr:sugar transferase [Cryobacterium lactosi]TFD91848.1 sugar transferase [Cryobacterium lactosi]